MRPGRPADGRGAGGRGPRGDEDPRQGGPCGDGNAPVGARTAFRTVDTIWRAIGDRSADFSWYTKRASLGAVYGATLLYWLNDDSEDDARTAEFLDRRIEALMLIPKVQGRLRSIGAKLPDPTRLLRRLRPAG